MTSSPSTLEALDATCYEKSQPQLRARDRFYRPELDVVRFIAFLLVFVRHWLPASYDPKITMQFHGLTQIINTWILASGYGLGLFFTLSAYLICELLLRERDASGSILVEKFYIRRILRIWPLYFASLAMALVIAVAYGDRDSVIWAAFSAVLLGNWFIVFHGVPSTPFSPLWSISIEEQFYLLVPWSIKYFSRRLLIAFACSLLVLANICLYFIGRLHISGLAVWYNSLVQFEFFAAGMLLCLMLRGRIPRMTEGARLTLAAAFITCWYFSSKLALTPRSVGDANAGSWPLIFGFGLAALGCCFLLLALLGLEKTQLPRSAIYLGRISYGLYVFHLPVLHLLSHNISIHRFIFKGENWFFNGLVGLGLTIVVASISYRFFEAPFLRLKNRYQTIESRPV